MGRVYVIPIHWIPSFCSFRANWVIILMCASSGVFTFFYQLQLNCKFELHTDNCPTEKGMLNSNHWNKIYSLSYRVPHFIGASSMYLFYLKHQQNVASPVQLPEESFSTSLLWLISKNRTSLEHHQCDSWDSYRWPTKKGEVGEYFCN